MNSKTSNKKAKKKKIIVIISMMIFVLIIFFLFLVKNEAVPNPITEQISNNVDETNEQSINTKEDEPLELPAVDLTELVTSASNDPNTIENSNSDDYDNASSYEQEEDTAPSENIDYEEGELPPDLIY